MILLLSATAAQLLWWIRPSRLVWWCFPRFDGDPIFSRLLSAEAGEGLHRRRSRRNGRIPVRLCPQHRGRFNRTDGRQGRRGQDHRFRAALSELRPDFPTRRNWSGSSSRSPACRESPSGFGQPINTECRCCRNRSAAITSHSEATTSSIRLTTDAPLSYIDREAPFVLTRSAVSGDGA